MATNPALELAFDYVAHTDRHLFLTGKAGTGKTTFLHRVKKEVHKRMCVVAPTGVAAINAGAQTIHSQFSLPFGFLEPGREVHRTRRFAKRKVELLQHIDLLIIDEISMVRADVLDAIDAVLRKYRRSDKPFGGVQLLMIGDLHQLPPVVIREEQEALYRHYRTPYFFGAKVMQEAGAIGIPLTHIYRQSDADFIDLLNSVRHNTLGRGEIDRLNSRYRSQPDDGAGQITLTSHNAAARRVNERNLSRLTTPPRKFSATVKGEFPKGMFPNDRELTFKIGAQVMFNKNDNPDGLYYNGKIGEITEIEGDTITVVCPGERPIEVSPVLWENVKMVVDELTGSPTERAVGTYSQHPLRLAWAITIHKSQGLTFDKVIIDAADSFSHGQVYVALSRCRTFEGITLRSKISLRSVKTDAVVTQHSEAAERNRPTEDDLTEDRRQFQITCLEHLFDFTAIEHQANEVSRALTRPTVRIQGDAINRFLDLKRDIREKLISVGRGFQPYIRQQRASGIVPETDPAVQTRLKAAASYYLNLLRGDIGQRLTGFSFLCENAANRSDIERALETLTKSCFIKRRLMEMTAEGFTAAAYSQTQTLAMEEFNLSTPKLLKASSPSAAPQPSEVTHPELFQELNIWRLAKAKEIDVPAYRIFSNKVQINLCESLPVTGTALLRIKGIGRKTEEQYGAEIVNIIKRYTVKKGISGNQGVGKAMQVSKATTFSETFELIKKGLSPTEIARQRGLREETVYIHAVKYLREGALTPEAVLGEQRHREVEEYTKGKGLADISILFHQARGRFELGEMRLVLTARSLVGDARQSAKAIGRDAGQAG